MTMIKIGVLCPSEIALRRFMPALKNSAKFEFSGIAFASPEEWFGAAVGRVGSAAIEKQQTQERTKAGVFCEQYGGTLYSSYSQFLSAPDVEAVYIPLPPGLHFRWASEAAKSGKHVFVEKPATTALDDTESLIRTVQNNGLALHENYMFAFHAQLDAIEKIIASGELGEVRLYRISFGFPRRSAGDFRYNKALGGGALLDCGGYTIRYGTRLLGKSAEIVAAHSNFIPDFGVDLFGSATMVNEQGVTAQLAFGMDNDYKCELEVWGSCGTLRTNRVLTAPAGFQPSLTISKNGQIETRELPADDTFGKSLDYFACCMAEPQVRAGSYANILRQAELVDQFQKLSEVR